MVVKEVEQQPFEISLFAKSSTGMGKDTLVGKAVVQQQALKDMFANANESVDIKGQLMTSSSTAGGGSQSQNASGGVAAGKFVLNMKFVTPDREGEIHTVTMMEEETTVKKPEVIPAL